MTYDIIDRKPDILYSEYTYTNVLLGVNVVLALEQYLRTIFLSVDEIFQYHLGLSSWITGDTIQ